MSPDQTRPGSPPGVRQVTREGRLGIGPQSPPLPWGPSPRRYTGYGRTEGAQGGGKWASGLEVEVEVETGREGVTPVPRAPVVHARSGTPVVGVWCDVGVVWTRARVGWRRGLGISGSSSFRTKR